MRLKGLVSVVASVLFAIAALPVFAQQGSPQIAPSRADAQRGAPYALGTYQDWSVRCVKADDAANDPCQMTQRLLSEDGSPTAEFSVFTVPNNPQAVAAATIVTPLETLLTRGVSISVDGGESREDPFQFCNRQGCIAQIGFTQAEVDAMKGGSMALLQIFPVAAPETPVNLDVSLAGFTTAYETMSGLPGLE